MGSGRIFIGMIINSKKSFWNYVIHTFYQFIQYKCMVSIASMSNKSLLSGEGSAGRQERWENKDQ